MAQINEGNTNDGAQYSASGIIAWTFFFIKHQLSQYTLLITFTLLLLNTCYSYVTRMLLFTLCPASVCKYSCYLSSCIMATFAASRTLSIEVKVKLEWCVGGMVGHCNEETTYKCLCRGYYVALLKCATQYSSIFFDYFPTIRLFAAQLR